MSQQVVTPLSRFEKEALLGRLEAMQIEPAGAERTFVVRLAQENNWTTSFSTRVLQEYGRFLYLAVTADHPVTPSDEVDQAWHLHLAYTRHYWEELCARILGRPLHHGPTAGGSAEASRYREQYEATLESYRVAFGRTPPRDIWPPSRERFAACYQRVDRRRNWVLPKLPWRLAAVAFLAAGCGVGTNGATMSDGALFITIAALILIIVAGIYISHRRHRDQGQGSSSSSYCGGGCGGASSKGTGEGCGNDAGCGGGCAGGCGELAGAVEARFGF